MRVKSKTFRFLENFAPADTLLRRNQRIITMFLINLKFGLK